MTWRWVQSEGQLSRDGQIEGHGYAGAGEGKNNPDMQDVQNIGPIPRGLYAIAEPCDTDTHGPYVLRLAPHADNEMCGRSGFLIHGDSKSKPGTASQGCIILPRAVREKIWQSGDRELEVV